MGLFSGKFQTGCHDGFSTDEYGYEKPVVIFYEDEIKAFHKVLYKLDKLGIRYEVIITKVFGREGYNEDDWWDVRWVEIDFRDLRAYGEQPMECVNRLWRSNRNSSLMFWIPMILLIPLFVIIIIFILITYSIVMVIDCIIKLFRS